MNKSKTRSVRLWPGIVIVALMCLLRFVVPLFVPEALEFGVIGGIFGGGLLMIIWWLFLSRAPWLERIGSFVFILFALFITSFFLHKSVATAMMGMMFPMYAIPVMSLVFVLGLLASRSKNPGTRRMAILTSTLLVCIGFISIRTDGMSASAEHDFAWRWSKTAEQKLLAQKQNQQVELASVSTPTDIALTWSGFRGANRDAVVHDLRMATDWQVSPPQEVWRQPVGPGVSSFAIRGHLFYTQEQRGEEEVVACYKLSTGEPVWMHRDSTRYWESHAGAGPRATPTIHNGRIYTLGATGIVNALNADGGSVYWSRNAAADTKVQLPEPTVWYGFSGSPLVLDSLVVVAVSGSLVAYDLETGQPRWFGPFGGDSYSSPQHFAIDGLPQVIFASQSGVRSFAASEGKLLWEYPWKVGVRIVQPKLVANHDMLISAGESNGLRRISISRTANNWRIEERWTTKGLKPNHSDFVVYDGHAYGFDGSILSCIELESGKRQWKGGRYGSGQMLLLAEQAVLLVLSEQGELALVQAAPDKFTELARMPAIEGKTWNHPALSGNILLIRNTREMAAFRLPPNAE